MAEATVQPDFLLLAGPSLPSQTWWTELHATINLAYCTTDHQALPSTWQLLSSDPVGGGQALVKQLGPAGHMVVVVLNGTPIACAGVTPFRGLAWIDDAPAYFFRGSRAEEKLTNGSLTTTDHNCPRLQHSALQETATHDASATAAGAQVEGWEIHFFCVHPDHRQRGLGRQILQSAVGVVRSLGAKRLYATYVVEELGEYWPRMGFEPIPTAIATLPKGWRAIPSLEGLRAEIHWQAGVMEL